MATQSQQSDERVSINSVSGDAATGFLLVPYGIWRMIFRGVSDDALILTLGPIILFAAIAFHWVALRRNAAWLKSWLVNGLVINACWIIEVGFVGWVTIADGVVPLFRLFQNFSVWSLGASCFCLWAIYGPAKAVAVLTDKRLQTAMREQGAAKEVRAGS